MKAYFWKWYNTIMKKLKKNGTPDKRVKSYKEELVKSSEPIVVTLSDIKETLTKEDPNELHAKLLKEHNLQLDFDVIEGTITTPHGIIKLDKPVLAIKATYVDGK